MGKRESEEVVGDENDTESSCKKEKKSEENCFVTGTTESKWSSPAERDYVLRYIHGETCCDAPFDDIEDWPVITLPSSIEWPKDEDDEDYDKDRTIDYHVIGAVWTVDDGRLVGFWGVNEDDSHVDFYVVDDYEHAEEDLAELSGVLCGTICPPLADTFDDGSGIDRDGRKVPADLSTHELLDNLYAV